MKLASLTGGRDGRLIVVSSDHKRGVFAPDPYRFLQLAIDDWNNSRHVLGDVSERLNAAAIESFPFNEFGCASPLPRAYQWADGSAYLNHVDLVRQARGDYVPESFWTDPLMYQGMSDGFLNPRGDIVMPTDEWGIDFEAEIAVIVDDVPRGADRMTAQASIRLIMLVNDISLRNLIPSELAKGFGFFQGKPASAFSPLAITPDELADAWDGGKVHLPLLSSINGTPFGKPNAGIEMTFDFPELIVHAAKTRRLSAGTIVGSGTVSNGDVKGGPGMHICHGGDGYSCISEVRMVEIITGNAVITPYLTHGDMVRIEMLNAAGQSLFGAIEQRVVISEE